MGYKIFLAIFSMSVFLYQQLHAAKPSKDEISYAAFRPSHYFSDLEYDLEFYTDVATFVPAYWGSVIITVYCFRETNKIFLDQQFLKINTMNIEAWEYNIDTEEINYHAIPILYGKNVRDNDGYKIKFKAYMSPNSTYKIKLHFSNEIYNNQSPAFIYTHYRQQNDHLKAKALVFTKMKNHLASHIFPCFNTAEMKAKFRVKIGHLENVNSFSTARLTSRKPIDNPEQWITDSHKVRLDLIRSAFMEEENNETPDSSKIPKIWVMDEFAETDYIEIFSVALAVVDFISDEPDIQMVGPPDSDLSAIEIRLWAEKDISSFGKEVQRAASQSLAFYSNMFGTPYNLGKLDLIVLPDENIIVEDYYGLIYLGEKVTMNNMLFVSSNHEEAYSFVLKICLAVGKQWIGHLVPLLNRHEKWFHDGLHNYLQRNCVIEAFEDWKLSIQLELIDSFFTLLREEERGRHYSIIQDLDPDFLSYFETTNSQTQLKVLHIIRMLSFILEVKENLFQKSLSDYIETFRSADPSLKRVWNSFTRTVDIEGKIFPEDVDVKKIFVSWLGKRGYPIINVARNEAGDSISLTQEHFLLPNQRELLPSCWPIAFDIVTKNQVFFKNQKVRKWLTCSATSPLNIPITGGKENDWIVLSLQLHVPARVYYDQKGWSLIKDLFHNENEIENVHSLTRLQIINDMFTFAATSKLTYDFVFEVIKYISREKDDKCLYVIFEELKRIRSRWIGTTLFEPFQRFVRTIVEPIFRIKVINIEQFLRSEHANNKFERNILITACTFELTECKQYSEIVLTQWINHEFQELTDRIPDFLQEYLLCLAMINASEDRWNFLMRKYEENHENTKILDGLGCSSNTEILKRYLRWSMNVKNPHTSAKVGLKVFEILSSRNDQGYQLIRPFFKKRRLNSFNKYARTLKKFFNKFQDLTIDDFLIKALEGTRNRDDLYMLIIFGSKLVDKDERKVIDEYEATSIAKRNISWFSENTRKVSEYFSPLSNNRNSVQRVLSNSRW